MTFGQALDFAKAGNRIRKKGTSPWYVFIGDLFKREDGGITAYYIAASDWSSEWEGEEVGQDFKWALEQLKAGKRVIQKGKQVGLVMQLSGSNRYLMWFKAEDGTLSHSPHVFFLEDFENSNWVLYK
jgi:hypothetical protein